MEQTGTIQIYQDTDGKAALEVKLDQETVWLTQKQMALLFGKTVPTINEHIKNTFKEGELEENSVVRNFRITAADAKQYDTAHYNLDVIISVGYRVKSQQGTRFRIWATQTLKDHLVKGYTVNQQRLQEQTEKLSDLRKTVTLLEQTIARQEIGLDEAKGLLTVITDYAYALTTLDRYDHGTLAIGSTTQATDYILEYDEAIGIVSSMKGEFGGLFGLEKDDGFKSALATIYQTFGGKELYPSVEEKAANLLYFVVKSGEKRNGCNGNLQKLSDRDYTLKDTQ